MNMNNYMVTKITVLLLILFNDNALHSSDLYFYVVYILPRPRMSAKSTGVTCVGAACTSHKHGSQLSVHFSDPSLDSAVL